MIYLDNAATSFVKPDAVYEEMMKCMKEYGANPGRGGHSLSIKASMEVMRVREIIGMLFNIKDPMRICFTKNATEALNVGISGYLKEGDHVITTSMEHNSVIRPLNTLKRDRKIELTVVQCNEYGEIDVEDIKRAIKLNTKLLVSTLSSNVNGIIMPVKEMGKIAKEKGICFLLDASQGAGSIKIDVEEMCIDIMAFPGHKGLLGPQGTGAIYIRDGLKLSPIIYGGTGSYSEIIYQPEMLPDNMESGTLNTAGIIGLGAGIEYIEKVGIEKIKKIKYNLVKTLHEGIEEISKIKIYSKNDIDSNSGIVAINFIDIDSTEVSYVLDRVYKIATRAGLHCSLFAHQTLGTVKTGIVRFSPGPFNTIDEIDITLNALREISCNI
ncbi:aminotransferase class V-fold PLP-dependent enzyme [Pseudobacteroides cellulosolvens]|uniref:cysteine desulfurase n=1 Tax=Pseudobacteroides cellulosolvens ATCC 35603 = DSM 2933 TaxID=398512 RepID=A0A0L6JIX5_9FIRM|nr:aminotransferase class V-fold PLP-dependent enzyme [Pseudobacteroides cellulosolvens]KNY25402.1 cysteine desulfurase family protein [Pseudobacteroides cellulosolvens ATCC 35603 = DSM 2933]